MNALAMARRNRSKPAPKAAKPNPKAPLGQGGRFAALSASLKGKVRNPDAVAAAIGRKKYGAKKMAQMSAAGRRH